MESHTYQCGFFMWPRVVLHPDGLHRLGHLKIALHIIGSVDGVHRRFHGFCNFPQFPLHCLFVKLIQVCHNSYLGAKINKTFNSSKKKSTNCHFVPSEMAQIHIASFRFQFHSFKMKINFDKFLGMELH